MELINTILFDIYGTLVDIQTNEHRDEVFEEVSRFLEYRRIFIRGRVLKELFFSEVNLQFARSRERNPEVDITQAFERVLRGQSQVCDPYLAMLTTQLYRALTRERLVLFDDTFWTLTEFRKRFRLGIVTDAQRVFCKPELRALRIEEFFDTVVISSDYGFRKPDPRLFHIALAAVDGRAEQAVYIGNKYETDIVGAKSAGLSMAILIQQSPEERSALERQEVQPDYVLNDLREAFDRILLENQERSASSSSS